MMGLSDGRKIFPIGLAVLIQYRRVTATHPATQPASHPASQPRRCSYYALTLKASSAKTSSSSSSGGVVTKVAEW